MTVGDSPEGYLAERRDEEIDAMVKASVKPSQFPKVYIPMFTQQCRGSGSQ